ncbi:CBS domain-containing protein [Egicoccus sp. AB-alg6-2]|uniref:CBS domain-containing protein n=1 Tax=Egicoccus sp. AB-alg6-2 TaxID=3242692 RepID=UPI00359CBC0E
MATKIRDLMTTDPIVCDTSTTAAEAARRMRDSDVGDVLVEEDGTLRGIVTDRDIALRVVADGTDGDEITIGEICSGDLVTVSPDDDLGDAVNVLREHHVRRVPVVEDGNAIGVLSIGDLAVTLDPDSALADISAAPENN